MDKKLSKIYYSPKGYWKGTSAIKKLADKAKVSEKETKKWLSKQAVWQSRLLNQRNKHSADKHQRSVELSKQSK